MRVSHNPSTKRQPANRGAQGHGQKRLDLNAPKQAPAIKTRKKRMTLPAAAWPRRCTGSAFPPWSMVTPCAARRRPNP